MASKNVTARDNEPFEKLFKRFEKEMDKSGHEEDVRRKSHIVKWSRKRGQPFFIKKTEK